VNFEPVGSVAIFVLKAVVSDGNQFGDKRGGLGAGGKNCEKERCRNGE
jgi:hypothetical protein